MSTAPERTPPKKKRKVLACNQCRRQKLRCDRAYPVCSRCRTVGSAEFCMYEDGHAQAESSGERRPATAALAVPRERSPETLENRQPSSLWRGRGQMATTGILQTPAATQPSNHAAPNSEPEPMIFRGSAFSTQYSGATHPISLIARFPELQRFMVEAISRDTALAHVQRSLKSLQLQWKQGQPSRGEIGNVDLRHLLELLPDQSTADQLIRTYWATFETTYRILYGPKFWPEYEALWSNPTAASASFVVVVLLAMATVSCVSPSEGISYMGDSSSPRERAVAWIRVCESWLECQSQKNISLPYWQSLCLILLAKIVNTIKKKETWTSAGDLMRRAMSAGFHRDPRILGTQMSRLNQELRRRLWATMIELELQVSMDRGMPSSAFNVSWDSANVLNVNDEELDEAGTEIQEQRSWTSYTAASFLHISGRSVSLRSSLNVLLNRSEQHLSHDEVMKYDEQIMHSLEEIASCKSGSGSNGSAIFPDLPLALLDIQLRQFLLLLHTPFAVEPISGSRYSISKLACFNAASSIIDTCCKLSGASLNAISLMRSDIFRSALATCQIIEASRALQSDMLLQNLGANLYGYVEKALARLGDNVTLLGTCYTNYWYISAAHGLLKSKLPSADAQVEQKVAVDQVIKQYYKVLASQEDISLPRATSTYRRLYGLTTKTPHGSDQTPSGDFPHLSPENLSLSQMFQLEPPDPQLEEYFFGDPAAWTFENLW